MKNVTEHSHSIWQIKVPVPFPLRWVNSYLIQGSTGYTLIDPGLHTNDARETWIKALNELQINFKDIEKIVLTHHHPDHYGLSGWFQERTSAPVLMSKSAYNQAVRLWGKDTRINQELVTLFERHGMEQETASRMLPHLESFISLVSPQPKVEFVDTTRNIRLGDLEYDIMVADGHASGQLCFYNRMNEEMFCGDQILPQITPNVSYLPGLDSNPLNSFLTSLRELSSLSVKKAYPGHREPFLNYTERIEQIIQHHNDRLQMMLNLLIRPLSVYEICRLVFGERLSIHQLRFPMAETLAHIVYLYNRGKVEEQVKGDLIVYIR